MDDIDFIQSPSSTFIDHSGREKSFKDYYKEQYNLEIKDPKQPLLITRAKVIFPIVIFYPSNFCIATEEDQGGGGRGQDHSSGARALQPHRPDGPHEGGLQGDEGRGAVHPADSHTEAGGQFSLVSISLTFLLLYRIIFVCLQNHLFIDSNSKKILYGII